MNRILIILLVAFISPGVVADVESILQATLAADSRSDAAKARDGNRKPVETLKFFGLTENQRVLELVPGGGWYTKLLAPVVKAEGQLYVAMQSDDFEQNLLKQKGLEQVKVINTGAEVERNGRRLNIKALHFDVQDIDLALTFRNLHNFSQSGRKMLNAEVFRVLKAGGYYGVVDHSRRHMQEDSTEIWRRMDPVQMIKEIEGAGFKFVDYSTLHYRPDDELRFEVGRKTVTGNTDRFTLLFRKPS